MQRRPFAWMTRVLVAMTMFFMGPAPAAAAMGLVGVPLATCVAPVRAGDTVSAMLAADARFDCDTRQTDFDSGDFWVRAASIPQDVQDRPLLRSASLWQDHATLWAVYADGARFPVDMDQRGINRRLQLGAMVEQRLPARDAALTGLLWRIDGATNLAGIVNGVHLATYRESARVNLLLGTLFGAFGGMCVGLLVYNLAIWAVLRHRFQLAYCGMLAILLVYALSSSGALAWMFPDLPNNERLRVNYVSLAAAGIMALLFARTFFEPRVFHPALSRAILAVCGTLGVSTLAFALLAPWQIMPLSRLYSVSFLAATLVALPMLWSAWRRGSRYLWLFVFAWAAPIGLAALRVAGNLDLVQWSFLLDNSTLPAMTLEALMSSLAIAYRIRTLTHERDDAREQEVAARLLADVDPLTALLNRRAFLREAIGRSEEQLLIIADIDHFKRVNDTIGHDGGDEVLRSVARALRTAAPADALVARIGGEEFAILIPAAYRTSPADILDHVRHEPMPFDLTVTISIGSAQAGIPDEPAWKRLYGRADNALYAAKSAGRDRARHDVRTCAA